MGNQGVVFFPGLFPIPRIHEDEFHEDKFTTFPPPLSPSGGGQGEDGGFLYPLSPDSHK